VPVLEIGAAEVPAVAAPPELEGLHAAIPVMTDAASARVIRMRFIMCGGFLRCQGARGQAPQVAGATTATHVTERRPTPIRRGASRPLQASRIGRRRIGPAVRDHAAAAFRAACGVRVASDVQSA
jgi:hypothetical protein